ncbi:MAG: hypothetical protein A2086_05855 [Spirochaetes bacterium GWD1_27_9]|nr:MAG: hypothetical protein A2Z98_01320 [Spirochaetes bacterium GWB1_27_13]OHD26685.1 MAG: hypothetical protein A2Y34_01745 [Spirochaetes bacterium GWC1_27_15]OHD35524.1 MAG: hypothetical protein A2086_05855 [Spirochaetes bacterium GWD1_27_9]
MRKSKKTAFDIIKEILSHILLIFVAVVVLLPILYVVSAGFRVNQAIFGPLVDVNTWTDQNIANRRENTITKDLLIKRLSLVFDGKTRDEIKSIEKSKTKITINLNDGSPELKNLKAKMITWIKNNGKDNTEAEFLDAYNTWSSTIDASLKFQADSQLFSESEKSKLRYKFDVRTSLGNFICFFTGTVPNTKDAKYPMLRWMWNSVFIAGSVALIQVVVTALASYVLSRFRFTGKKESLMVLLTLQVFPGTMAMVALYLLLQYLGNLTKIGFGVPIVGIDTQLGLILIYLGGGIPFNIWMVKGYFDTIPKALEESAIIDGATTWQAFTTIIVPLVRPILAVAVVLSFVGMYNEFVLAAVVLNKPENYTLPVGLRFFMNAQQDARFGVFSAASIMGSLPIVVLWLGLQNQIIAGLTGGAVKG